MNISRFKILSGKKTLLLLVICLLGLKSHSQVLSNYITEAQENNPKIEAMRLQYKVSEEKENQADVLPDTKFSAGYFVSAPETRVGAQQVKVSASQQLPWFGTLTARENYAESLSAVDYQKLVVAKRKLSLDVSQSFYTLYSLQAKIKVIDENIELLKSYRKLALSDVENDRASSVEVMRLRIRENDLKDQKETFIQKFNTEAGAFNQLLNRDIQETPLMPDTLVLPEEQKRPESLKVHPELLQYDKLYEAVEKSEAVNQKEAAPKFGVGVNYIAVEERQNAVPDNGKDIVMPMLSLSIPIFNNKYSSVSKEHEIEQKRIKAEKTDQLQQLKTRANESLNNQKSARISIETQIDNLKQAKDAISILQSQYETGELDYEEVLDVQELQLKIQLKKVDAVQYYFNQHAILNYLSPNSSEL